ncbi:hypothetical protein L249_4684 [Ophiocordyceps polyrhachis-furcata BCC 54312]|uniref:Uncharacterized protein n=1 Tax=Ophiocordyceps polyrhachis-furcata BCC 54312 TaxID=1330021 RepID=A0A367L2S7_9HYPO|nr:hypothetical protein L249_4684 [Ophiocordyceps polyrhachis-furcata BCC 54312]
MLDCHSLRFAFFFVPRRSAASPGRSSGCIGSGHYHLIRLGIHRRRRALCQPPRFPSPATAILLPLLLRLLHDRQQPALLLVSAFNLSPPRGESRPSPHSPATLRHTRPDLRASHSNPTLGRLDPTPYASPVHSAEHASSSGPSHSLIRIPRRAILFALEEALRHPHLFTPDLIEESATMADLATASNGGGLGSPPRRPLAGPPLTGSPSAIRGPRVIMQERAAREARQKAEAEKLAMERNRAEQEARLAQDLQRRAVERRPVPEQPIDPRYQVHPDPRAQEAAGLTSYWIRKLEQNKDEVNRDPLSQQLARQVTDLSAAGANLFHAVVELQRLRASSERKFQRWFFETRAELERAREVNAMMDAALQKERQDRADAIRDAIDQERGSTKIQKQLVEMRKELSISKEEARRAWEELGRREQEERDRTYSLQAGQPTMVGGVQVVPMTHGRNRSTRDSAGYPQDEYARGPRGGQADMSQASPSHTPPPTTAPQVGDDHRRQRQPENRPRGGPEVGYKQGECAYGRIRTRLLMRETGEYEPPPSTSAGEAPWTGEFADPQDYTGQGYGAPGWETVPRHHHPTRLSDVIEEEDERSRTSASLMSRG